MGLSKRSGGWGFRLQRKVWGSDQDRLLDAFAVLKEVYQDVCLLDMEEKGIDFVKDSAFAEWTQEESAERERFFLEIIHDTKGIKRKKEKIQIISRAIISSEEEVISRIGSVLFEFGDLTSQDYQKLLT
jgi:hypothetical protein